MWGAQDVSGELNKITHMVDGFSGISTGEAAPATSANHRIAAYEAVSLGGKYFYGLGIIVNANTAGLGLWGGTDNALPEQATGSGRLPHMLVTPAGRVGINNQNPSEMVHIGGNLLASGTISGSVKAFDIQHEGEDKEGWRLRHWCVEGDSPGGSLCYKRQVVAPKAGIVDIIMPKWFAWLAQNVMVFSTGVRHHGTAWAEQDALDPCVLHLNVSRGGTWNVMICADRADTCATTMCPQEVEYFPPPPTQTPDQAFPP